MIVTCESCKTKFRLDPSRFKKEEMKVRCSRCSHVFSVQRPQEEVFLKVDVPAEEIDFEDDFPVTPPPRDPASFYVSKKKSRTRRVIFLALLTLVVVACLVWFGSLSGLLSSSKSESSKFGPGGAAEQPSVTILDTTQAYFLENTHIGQIFVIEGEVENESLKPVSFIMVEGKLYGNDNRVVQSQRCFSGNVLKRDELTRLNITEIQNKMMNREGQNLSNVHVVPGKRIPFMVVFHNLPELDSLSDYSVEFISAKLD
jgi:predicted Zn finger-like uncharacterized protein